ncbi:epidermal growth factor receptor kinase substrate 8-like protein 1 [Hemicordylus capensis]|uniref:epidermal growth factor receptor kinase substrate 8-like protein 1 n=1 Tax=Hemicordylus capensis TaxID=884348 RepID=UPI0023037EA5|nr:epidermal growth factor receptor kinase substrate 8-like protein 1 [Hemicordylus capensis]XP_053117148.1 epidermal growth factor receptor kinase substrate 8-like protein 1 [Hemicordylus capensis]XP_053117149.1 epidermal growth factor receptor kinase substrate 8-like protein 1 [Hemicordylus capensis]XP_053117150.1 epidermal growth factor receptor kinase substrate 8-like protein 1 [Hemicordylus capensis]
MSDSGSLGSGFKPSARAIYEQRKKYSHVIMADVSQYAVKHLVTFAIGEEDDLASVEDATRKLSIMDAQGKIWAQEMLLQVNGSAIKLFDVDSKEELENYGLAAVARCEAVRPETRSRPLLLLVCQDPDQLKPDIHLFECDNIGAELIRKDINSALLDFKSGGNAQRKEALRATQDWLGNQTEKAQETLPQSPREVPSRTKVITPALDLTGKQMENGNLAAPPNLSSLRAERDVELLNQVFDDVEFFVGKLQKSAEAFRVLDQRKRSARGRRREPGEGLLTLRAKPPPQEEYEDALAKMKYSFSLLARLKSNITNPTSEELIHFLFGPLKMVVATSGGPEFASELRSPMLTLEAVTLMRGCLKEQEMELWHSLGQNWTKPRVDFPRDYAAPYTPTFRSGWQPPRLDPSGQPWEDPVEMQHRHEERRAQQSAPTIAANGDKHAEDKWMSCTYDFVARNSNELSVLKGDVVEVLDDSKKWWKVQNSYSQVGYVPYNILTPLPTGDFSSTQNNTTIAQINGKSPVITKKTPPQPPPKSKGLYSNSNGKSWASTERLNMDVNERERFVSVNEELALRLANGTTGRCKSLQIQRTPDTSVPLGYDSDPAQVHAWLEAKGFHPLTASALGVLNGAQLFSLKKDEFKAVSPEEGIRVYSQVTVQKALLEDSRKISELQAVMERQKRKVDSVTE